MDNRVQPVRKDLRAHKAAEVLRVLLEQQVQPDRQGRRE
jgi:hypothetical protein